MSNTITKIDFKRNDYITTKNGEIYKKPNGCSVTGSIMAESATQDAKNLGSTYAHNKVSKSIAQYTENIYLDNADKSTSKDIEWFNHSSKYKQIPKDKGISKDGNKLTLVEKIAVAIASTILAVFGTVIVGISVVHAIQKLQVKNIKNIQKAFQKVFMRDGITIEETKNMMKRYKEIEKIADRKEYVKALFEEIKKNFGMEKSNIKLIFEDSGIASGYCTKDNSKISITSKCPRRGILNTLHHEFRHAKQHEILLPYEYKEHALNNLLYRDNEMFAYYLDCLKKQRLSRDEAKQKTLQKFIDKINEYSKKHFGELPPENVPLIDDEFVKKLIEADKNYVRAEKDFSAYWNNFKEIDARWAGLESECYIQGRTKIMCSLRALW